MNRANYPSLTFYFSISPLYYLHMRNPESRPERQFSEPKEGTFWEVFEYSEPGEQSFKEDYVAKRLKKHLVFDEYYKDDHERTIEENQEITKYLRRERDHLRRFYGDAMPDLIPKEKIVFLPPKEGHPAGEILSVQEKLGDHIPIYQLRMAELSSTEQKEIRDQLETFVSITKSMADARDEQDPEFSKAIPDITHLSNLAVENKNGKILLRLFDTNYVLPVDNERALLQHHLERCAYRLFYIEHHLLGRTLDQLGKDTFYQNSETIDFIQDGRTDVPNFGSKELYYLFNHPSSIPPWQRDQSTPDVTVVLPKK